MTHTRGVILDVDGTLVNSNDAHAKAWVEAMEEYGYHVPFEKVRPLIGMGGDKVLPETIGVQKDSEEGQKISKRRGEIFKEKYLPTLKPFPKAHELLQAMRQHGLKLAVASSSQKDELKALLSIVGAQQLIEEETSAKDAPNSNPNPEVVEVTLQHIGLPANEVLMLGDTAYDIEAAQKVDVSTIALRSGGWKDSDLQGAIAIYNDTADLLAHYEDSPLAK
ncbi:MAG: HAD family hydrolase [Chloroflexota bacterium]|nr:HAD family hydrolase [Chloroflexota bacterium]